MQERDLLPGVTVAGSEPKVVCHSRAIVTRARRLALLRDLSQLLLVAVVDWLFLYWTSARIPVLSRESSLIVVLAFNAAVATHIYLVRNLPHWTARRIASTWCAAERKRFVTTAPSRARR